MKWELSDCKRGAKMANPGEPSHRSDVVLCEMSSFPTHQGMNETATRFVMDDLVTMALCESCFEVVMNSGTECREVSEDEFHRLGVLERVHDS